MGNIFGNDRTVVRSGYGRRRGRRIPASPPVPTIEFLLSLRLDGMTAQVQKQQKEIATLTRITQELIADKDKRELEATVFTRV